MPTSVPSIPRSRQAVRIGTPVQLPDDPARHEAVVLVNWLLLSQHLERTGRVHAETILTEIGAVAGFAGQMAVRYQLGPHVQFLGNALVEVETHSGEKFYFGDMINGILYENGNKPPYSIWSFVAGAVPNAGRKTLPDIIEIVKRGAATVGSREFGIPNLPKRHMPHRMPRVALNRNWPAVKRTLTEARRTPADWPYDLAIVAQQLIDNDDMRSVLAPKLAAQIVMEAAIPMAKIDPKTVPHGTLDSQ